MLCFSIQNAAGQRHGEPPPTGGLRTDGFMLGRPRNVNDVSAVYRIVLSNICFKKHTKQYTIYIYTYMYAIEKSTGSPDF